MLLHLLNGTVTPSGRADFIGVNHPHNLSG
jgi:hypothetical protein